MTDIRVDRDVAAPADRVWRVMTDLEGATGSIRDIRRIERLDAHDGFTVGTRWRETRVMFGKEFTEELEVTEIDPGRSYAMEADSPGAHYRSVMSVEPLTQDTSRLSLVLGAVPESLRAKVLAMTFGRLFAGSTRKQLRRDLDDIAASAERTP